MARGGRTIFGRRCAVVILFLHAAHVVCAGEMANHATRCGGVVVHLLRRLRPCRCCRGVAGAAIQRPGDSGRDVVADTGLGLCAQRDALRRVGAVVTGIAAGGGDCTVNHCRSGKTGVAQVTGVALQRTGRNVAHRHRFAATRAIAARRTATVAAIAGSGWRRAGVRARCTEETGSAVMAGFTPGSGRHVAGKIGLAHHPGVQRGVAMAGDAVHRDAGVVHLPGDEAAGCGSAGVAVLARHDCGRRWDVNTRFAQRGDTVMAARAARNDACMVHVPESETGSAGMAALAGGGGHDVVGGLALHTHKLSAVAGGATGGDAGVVHRPCRKAAGRRAAGVAALACHAGGDVGGRLAHHPGILAVVAGRAAAADAGVVHVPGGKAAGGDRAGVAGFAGQHGGGRWDVCRRFAGHSGVLVVVAACAIEADAGVIHDRAEEAGGVLVAGVARGCRRDMRGRFGRTVRAAAVAVAAGAGVCAHRYAAVVERAHQEAGVVRGVGVAAIARCAGAHVSGGFAQRLCAVMAGGAGPRCHARMVERGSGEAGGTEVAGLATGACGQVVRVAGLALHTHKLPAVAGGATGGDAGVVHRPCRKAAGRRAAGVAALACHAGGDVYRGLAHHARILAVVAGRAAAADAGVVHRPCREARGVGVAVFTCSSSNNVGRRFAHYPGKLPAVATRASSRDAGVVHRPTGKASRSNGAGMAGIACRRGGDMCGGFAHHACILPAVTARASSCDAGVIHAHRFEACGAGMARIAIIPGGGDMGGRLAHDRSILTLMAGAADTGGGAGVIKVCARKAGSAEVA